VSAKRDNDKKEQVKQRIDSWKRELKDQKENIEKVENLINKQIDRNFELDLWELSEKELDLEMGNRLSMLNEDIDIMRQEKITSHRKVLGFLIVPIKKLARKILLPDVSPFFERQKLFNEGVVAYLLASFIRFRSMEQRLRKLERDIAETEDTQETKWDGTESSLERQKQNDTERKR
jgi:hypothetical protein